MSQPPYRPPPRNWPRKFADAFSGLAFALREQSSFHVHAVATVAVLAASAALRPGVIEWCLLLGAIALVWTVELVNTALETLARAIDQRYNEHLRVALNLSSAAVLAASLGAVAIGALILGPRLWALLPAS